MSSLLRRPPAREVVWPRLQGPSDRQSYAGVDSAKNYGGANEALGRAIRYVWFDLLQINPVREQPKLILYSAAQPFVRTGHMRRWSRTFMSASSPFRGRWAFVGAIQRQYALRDRMTGVPMRTGITYQYPRFKTTPRSVVLGRPVED